MRVYGVMARSGKVRFQTPKVPKTNNEKKKVGRTKIKSKLENKTRQYKSGNQRINVYSDNQHFEDKQLNTAIGIERYLFREEKKTYKDFKKKFRNNYYPPNSSNTKKWHNLEREIYQERNTNEYIIASEEI
ncbi:hypothetical protein ABK040_014420 [Willaertia magna]